ncbi:DUF763 domain-containing protein [candidate division WOR-3 bacterium]|nr:DUF763 domain-containing protein [candidate division WOR-3 bacterium]
MKKTGIANLPLHYGRAPRWLFSRMERLSREIICAIIIDKGTKEVLKRLSDPFWFQAFGSVLGFDWHSSGLTTTVCGAVKSGFKEISKEYGFYIAGGKGRTSRRTPEEIETVSNIVGLNPKPLIYASRMAAKVDTSGIQDGYQIYHHVFFFTDSGEWTVVQQGMNETSRYARRYHWLGEKVEDFVCEPHSGIECEKTSSILNLVAEESCKARKVITSVSKEEPEKVIKELKRINELHLPSEHPVRFSQIRPDRIKKILVSTYERAPENFETLLGIRGVGPKTIRALSLISELTYGVQPSFTDPARFSFAHGGKDGHPYPVNKKVYDESINFLKDAVSKAKIGKSDKLKLLKKLHSMFR